ncbi:MAG: pyrroline-5-carboxylate reductase, partial [Pseudomonadota bacterium]
MTTSRIAFIGGGNMARAIVRGLIDSGYDAGAIAVADPLDATRDALARDFPGITVESDNAAVVAGADCVVLAVKPQVLPGICPALVEAVQREQPMIVSIAAGVRGDDIDRWLGGGLAVVRVMPNQPALLRLGVSGLYANPQTTPEQVDVATRIMQAVGSVVRVDAETLIDSVTAVSGSGPAYFFLVIDMLANAGVELGLPEGAARTMAIETAAGAAALAAASEDSMETQIARVRSPGGTTAAALDTMDEHGVR